MTPRKVRHGAIEVGGQWFARRTCSLGKEHGGSAETAKAARVIAANPQGEGGHMKILGMVVLSMVLMAACSKAGPPEATNLEVRVYIDCHLHWNTSGRNGAAERECWRREGLTLDRYEVTRDEMRERGLKEPKFTGRPRVQP